MSDFLVGVLVGIGLSGIFACICFAAKGASDAMKYIRGDRP